MLGNAMKVKYRHAILIGLVLVVALSVTCPTSAQVITSLKQKKLEHKDDLVIMENGDRNTGEIKKVEFGVLYLKSDLAADTLKLDWKRVTRLQSKARYEFEIKNRKYYIGVINPDMENQIPMGEMQVVLDDGSSVRLKIADVIGIREMQRSILGRLNLSLDAGISFTSANNRAQINVNSSIEFQKPKYSGSLDVNSQFSGEPGATDTSRHELKFNANRVLARKWEAVGLLAFLHDNQQELDLRTTAGGGLERVFVKSNRTFLSAIGGLVYTNENYFSEAQSDRKNAEFLAGLNFSTYHFRGSELSTSLFVFPSVSDPGRVRIDAYADWKWDIVADLYWKVGMTNNYDSRPPTNGINNNLSITSTVGWSF